MRIPQLLLLTFFYFSTSFVFAQKISLYSYDDLSARHYAKQKDSLKKAWVCSPLYTEKATQKKYKEIWDERTGFIVDDLADNGYVYEKELLAYIDNILEQLVGGNKELFSKKPMLLLDRATDVNAYAVGSNLLAVNVGMMAFVKTREELALIIAHELAHNIMEHPETGMKQKAEWLTSDEYKKSMNAILDSKYERFSRLKKVVEGFTFSRSRHQRYKEGDADSLAIVLLKNSKITFTAEAFLRLDSSDMQYRQPLAHELKYYFSPYQLTPEDAWLKKKSKGLSTRAYNFKDSTNLDDSLKTHPECVERYEHTKSMAGNGKLTPVPEVLREKARRMIIWQLYQNMRLTQCLYRILLEKDNGNTDKWYDFMISNIFTGLSHAEKELKRFNAIHVIPKEYISANYYELQTMLEQMPREAIEKFAKTLNSASFWDSLGADEKAFGRFISGLAFDAASGTGNIEKMAKDYAGEYPASTYREFTTMFEKK